MSDPFVERLIESIRRELLDQTLFWNDVDTEKKLPDYQYYFNEHRCHSSLDCVTPVEVGSDIIVEFNSYRCKKHRRGQFQ